MLGAQRPRVSHVPEYVTSAGDVAIELALLAGLELDDWQQYVLRESLGERADGKWAAPTVGLVVGRQNGKGSILEARELAGLFLLDERLIVHTAHRQKIATNHFRRVRDLIRGVPDFNSRVAKISEGKGSEAIELKDGRRIEFATRMSGNARGLTADLLVYDEAMFLSETDRSGIAPTMAARSMDGNVQSWYVGSAVDQQDQAQDGVPFAQVRLSGIAGADGVAWFEWSAEGDDPDKVTEEMRCDPHAWAQANPGLGIRIAAEWIEHERTVEMGPRGFAVERLSIGDWPDPSPEAGRVISSEAWAAVACRDESKWIVGPKTFALDVNPDRTRATIDVAGQRQDELWHVAVVERHRRTDWIVNYCKGLKGRLVVDKRGPAANLIPELIEAGVEVIEADTGDYAKACSGFFDAVANQTLRYPAPQPELDDAVADARTQPMGDAWKWSRKNSTSADITPLVAGTLALWGAQNAENQYATLLLPGGEAQGPNRPERGPGAPQVVSQEEQTACFACSQGACERHMVG